jgi:hypothetical protein
MAKLILTIGLLWSDLSTKARLLRDLGRLGQCKDEQEQALEEREQLEHELWKRRGKL